MTTLPPDDVPRLLSALADGTLNATDEQRLAERLKADPSARAKYYDHVMLAALLRREGRRAAAQPLSQPLVVPPSQRRYQPWLLVLAASLLLSLLLSVSEATGVTHFVPSIIRIVTGEGALVIEVDDPSVSVALDGQDITITGAGVHELRLRPGTHAFVATKGGQPIREEVLIIEHGGRQVVKITREQSRQINRVERLEQSEADYAETETLLQEMAPVMANDPWRAELHFRKALALCDELLQHVPENPKYQKQQKRCRRLLSMALNLQAHTLVYKKETLTAQESAQAIAAASEAVTLSPWDEGFYTNLGMANYRAGDWQSALAALEKGPSLQDYNSCRTRFCLALANWRLGNPQQARQLYEQAVQWMHANKPDDYWLRRDRAEATALLEGAASPNP